MASPTVAVRTESALTTAGTSFTVNFTQTTNDLVILLVAGISDLWIVGEGFTNLAATGTGGSSLIVYYKILDGSEGGSVVATAASQKGSALAYNIQGHDTVQGPESSTEAGGTSTTPDPGTVTPTGGAKDYLWLATFVQAGEEADDDTWCTAAPTSFTNLIQKTSGTGGAATSNVSGAAANFASNAASMNPATFTTVQSLTWRAFTIAVHPAAGAAAHSLLIPHRHRGLIIR